VWRRVAAEAGPPARDAPLAPPVYIVADDPYRQWLVDRFLALGIAAETPFNTDFDVRLPRAAGHTLVIAMVGDRLVLPEKYWPTQTVISVELLRPRQGETARGVFQRRHKVSSTMSMSRNQRESRLLSSCSQNCRSVRPSAARSAAST
jgi:hypothetical protein